MSNQTLDKVVEVRQKTPFGRSGKEIKYPNKIRWDYIHGKWVREQIGPDSASMQTTPKTLHLKLNVEYKNNETPIRLNGDVVIDYKVVTPKLPKKNYTTKELEEELSRELNALIEHYADTEQKSRSELIDDIDAEIINKPADPQIGFRAYAQTYPLAKEKKEEKNIVAKKLKTAFDDLGYQPYKIWFDPNKADAKKIYKQRVLHRDKVIEDRFGELKIFFQLEKQKNDLEKDINEQKKLYKSYEVKAREQKHTVDVLAHRQKLLESSISLENSRLTKLDRINEEKKVDYIKQQEARKREIEIYARKSDEQKKIFGKQQQYIANLEEKIHSKESEVSKLNEQSKDLEDRFSYISNLNNFLSNTPDLRVYDGLAREQAIDEAAKKEADTAVETDSKYRENGKSRYFRNALYCIFKTALTRAYDDPIFSKDKKLTDYVSPAEIQDIMKDTHKKIIRGEK